MSHLAICKILIGLLLFSFNCESKVHIGGGFGTGITNGNLGGNLALKTLKDSYLLSFGCTYRVLSQNVPDINFDKQCGFGIGVTTTRFFNKYHSLSLYTGNIGEGSYAVPQEYIEMPDGSLVSNYEKVTEAVNGVGIEYKYYIEGFRSHLKLGSMVAGVGVVTPFDSKWDVQNVKFTIGFEF